MNIKDLPPDIQDVAWKYHKEQRGKHACSNKGEFIEKYSVGCGFVWDTTVEGRVYWTNIDLGKFPKETVESYPIF